MSRNIHIVICHRSWVFIGECERKSDGMVHITNAKTIRRWGTTTGLGQLRSGPTVSTILDDTGTVVLHPLQVIAEIPVDADKWHPILSGSH